MIFEDSEGGLAVLDLPEMQVDPLVDEPFLDERFDLVLGGRLNPRDSYCFYNDILCLAEKKKGLAVYAPHRGILKGAELEDELRFTVETAIPQSEGALVDLSNVDGDVREIFSSVHEANRPFLLLYREGTLPFPASHVGVIRNHSAYRGEFSYSSEGAALRWLDGRLDMLGLG